MQNIMDAVNRAVNRTVRAEAEAAGQITLGDLITKLEACKPDSCVMFDWGGLHPGKMRSYRGFYDHLAIDPTGGEYQLVKDFLDHARRVLGSTMEGYKGGDFVMDADTLVWVAPWGDTSDTRVVGVTDDGWRVTLRTTQAP